MNSITERNRQYLTDLFAGPFRGHAIIMDPPPIDPGMIGDVSCPDHPVSAWLDPGLREYEARMNWLAALDDDSVPYIRVGTGTQIFAASFGCEVRVAPQSNAFALPLVETAAEADALVTPSLDAEPIARCFEYARLMQERLGREVPVTVPDIQSPFDIAALIWRKETMFVAMIDDPDAVLRLVAKCHDLLTRFLQAWKQEFPECSLCHCPNAWAPPQLGCWLSEDEAGSMSTPMFERYCLPTLTEMSETFGGLFMHCCATADHQYESFQRIPNLRGLNRVFQAPGPRPAIETFSGGPVLMMAWMLESQFHELLDMAKPNTRYLLNMGWQPLDEARATYDRLRSRCPRG